MKPDSPLSSLTGLQTLLEIALDAVVVMDTQGKVVEFNPAAETLFGYTRAEILGQPLAETLVPHDLRDAHKAGLKRYLATGEAHVLGKRIEISALKRDGSLIDIELAIDRLPGETLYFMAYIRDITERKRSARALETSENRLATLVANLYAGVLLEDENRKVALTNQKFCDLFQVPVAPEQLIGQDCSQSGEQSKELFATPEQFVTRVGEILAAQEPVREEELRLADGRILERDYLPIFYEANYRGHLWVYRDITERKQTEKALQKEKELMAALSMASQQFLDNADLEGTFGGLLKSLLSLTKSDYGFLGEVLYTLDGKPYVKTHAITSVAWNDATQALSDTYTGSFEFRNLEAIFGEVLTTEKPVIANDPTNDPRCGSLPPNHPPLEHFLGLPVFRGTELVGIAGIANRPGGYDEATIAYLQPFLSACANIISAYRDDAARAEAVRMLSEANHFVSRINDTAPMLIYLYDLNQRRDLYANRSIAEMLNYSPETRASFVGRELASLMHPEDRRMLQREFRRLRSSTLDETLEFECRLQAASGAWRWYHSRYTVFQRNHHGRPDQILGAAVDVTERKEAEEALQSLTSELQRSNKALQEFASIASHDLKEPLRKIQAFGGRLKSKEAQNLSTDGQDYLARMLSAAERMQVLIDDLLAYSRVTSKAQPFVAVNLNNIAYDVVSDLEARVLQSGGRVRLEPLPELEADPLQMRQLLQNLIGNALKFARPGVAPEVVVWAESAGKPGFTKIFVSDNGIGFAPEYTERIFEVFERLHGHGTYEGTGMGLAISRRIVERHGGTIQATSTPGEGALFTIEIPLFQKGAGA
ncbi:PAS domain-containing sensor histidine kinase [Armatimonas rosea]|uniref:histidine kinase n=1 Tax=Armatimonas rosea TaxID=685828 RepID=A0A7W9SM64_ARMRO|nr:PAS domain S-box protein [Armatimonas rosea]MBB6048729.1 PAS domain S-box-containing protein [Armatimonas rosea]